MGDLPLSGGRGGREGARRAVLLLIVLVYLISASAYALKTPKWNNPDEPAHYNYVRHVATTGSLPVLEAGDYDQAYLEQLKPLQFPDSLSVDAISYESHQPPLYYLLGAPVYRVLEESPVDTRVLALRGLSILLGALLMVVAYLIVREALPKWPVLALGTAGFVGTLPMHVAMTAAINNDTLAELVLSLALLLMLRGLRRGFGQQLALTLGVVLGAALLTKVMAYTALPLAAAAIWMRARIEASRRHGDSSTLMASNRAAAGVLGAAPAGTRRWAIRAVQVYAPAAIVSLWWFARNVLTYGANDPFGLVRHDAVVVGQPRTSFTPDALQHFLGTTFQSFWGQFGWMGIVLDRRLYLAAGLFSAVALVGFAVFLWRTRRGEAALSAAERYALALLGLCVFFVVGALVYYNLTFIQAQGRYLFPAIVPIGLVFVAGIAGWLPRALLAAGLLATYLGLLVFNYLALIRFIAPYFGT